MLGSARLAKEAYNKATDRFLLPDEYRSEQEDRYTCPCLEGQEPEEQNRIFNGDTDVEEGSIQTGHERNWSRWFEELCTNPNVELQRYPIPSLYARRRLQVFLQHIAEELKLPIDCVCTAATYLMRYYKLIEFDETFSKKLATPALFLAGKAIGNYRKAEHVIKVTHASTHRTNHDLDVRSEIGSKPGMRPWYYFVHPRLTEEMLTRLTAELERVIVIKRREATESSRIAAEQLFIP